jgi:hypothetical protein
MVPFALSALSRRGRPAGASPTRRHSFRPRLEALEDRCVPAHWAVTSQADNVNQPGTLRWAVAQANNDNGDTIDIQTTQPIVLANGELYLARSVTIDFTASAAASRATIDANFSSRVFEVAPAARVNLDNLDLIDGIGLANNPSVTSFADGVGGAIFNQGTLALTACTLAHNGVAFDPLGNRLPPTNFGGGILNNANPRAFVTPNPVGGLTLTRCEMSGNQALVGGGGIDNILGSVAVLQSSLSGNHVGPADGMDGDGGGVKSFGGVLLLASSALDSNTALDGGAVASVNTMLFVLACDLYNNRARFDGGGVKSFAGSFLTIDSAYDFNNSEHGAGGGIANDGAMVVLSCLFTDNLALLGGAIFNGPGSTATVETSNLSNNAALFGGGIYNTGVLNLGFSLLQTNTPDNLRNLATYNDLGGNTFI